MSMNIIRYIVISLRRVSDLTVQHFTNSERRIL